MDDERFIPLAAFVRGLSSVSRALPEPVPFDAPPPVPHFAEPARGVGDVARAEFVHDLTLMRLAASEAFEGAKQRLLESLAEAVLGRELALAPADIETIAKRVIALHEIQPVSLVLGAADAERIRTPFPTRVDASLGAGDLIVEVRDGVLESRFAFRLQAALDRAAEVAK